MAKFTYEQLVKKYGDFRAPKAVVRIGKKDLSSFGWKIKSVESITGTGTGAGVCLVEVSHVYDSQKSRFLCEKDLIAGSPAEVELGYVNTEPVFSGYLHSLEYSWDMEQEPGVTLVCMDVKGAMMEESIRGFTGKSTYQSVIQSFFTGKDARGYRSLAKAPDLSALPQLKDPVAFPMHNMDDFTFLSNTARLYGLEWFVQKGRLLIRAFPDSMQESVELSPAAGLRSLTAIQSTEQYVSSVTVRGGSDEERDGNKKTVSATVKNSGSPAPAGSEAEKLLKTRKLELYLGNVRNEAQAKAMAAGALRGRRAKESDYKMQVRGLPELVSGEAVALKQVSPALNGTIYLTSVIHRMDEKHYTTQATGRRLG